MEWLLLDALFILAMLGAAGLVYSLLAGAVAWLVTRRRGFGSAVALALALSIAYFATGVTLVEALGAALLRNPPLTGGERQGAERGMYVLAALGALAVVYVSTLPLSAVVGHRLGQRLGQDRFTVATVALAALTFFLLLSSGIVSFATACFIGVGTGC